MVDFSVPQTILAPVLSIPRRTGTQIEFNFSAAANRGYTVEFASSLNPSDWRALVSVAAANTATQAVVSDVIEPAPRFYRTRTP